MTQAVPVLTVPIVATAALEADRIVNALGAYPAAAARGLGASMSAAAIGDRIPVTVLGTAVLTAGTAIAAGANVEVGATGKVITRAAGFTVGIALQAASADGAKFEALLLPSGP